MGMARGSDTPLDDQPDGAIVRRRKASGGPVEDYRPRRGRSEDDDLPSEADVERFSDVTVKCPHCGTEMFDDAEICWHCGMAILGSAPIAPRLFRGRRGTLVVVILAVLAMLGIFFAAIR